MYHVLWPEGLPQETYCTTSEWKARWHLFKMQGYYNLPWNWSKARRMRWARAEDGYPIASYVEQSLEKSGATPPPGGWSKPSPLPPDVETGWGEVFINTFSVI